MTNESEKKRLRRFYLAQRRSLPPAVIAQQSTAIAQNVSRFVSLSEAKTIMCYAAMRDEVQTKDICTMILEAGKQLCIPYIYDLQAGLMDAVYVRNFSDLTIEAYGILSVKAEVREVVAPETIDAIILPGVAFDRTGNRLGMGAGFYDRFLRLAPQALTVGLAFSCQIAAALPCLPHDDPVEYVITEAGILDCKTGKM